MMPCKIYNLIDKDTGEVAFKGTMYEIGQKLNYCYRHLYGYADKTIGVLGKYYIVSTNEATFETKAHEPSAFDYTKKDKAPEKKRVVKKKPKPASEYENLKMHLLIYGNTILMHDPKKYVDKLHNEGIDISWEFIPARTIKYEMGSQPLKDKKHWIITATKIRKDI